LGGEGGCESGAKALGLECWKERWNLRVLLQRVAKASVSVEGKITGSISRGMVMLVGVGHGDTQAIAMKMVEKIVQLRVFSDAEGKFNLSLLDVGGGALIISQFTLFADSKKGRRPSYTDAARPEVARPLLDFFVEHVKTVGVTSVGTGVFGAHMDLEIHNDGPVTIWLDSAELGM
jgi:D-tyrosyl-tRNA(Tyr) deacylase